MIQLIVTWPAGLDSYNQPLRPVRPDLRYVGIGGYFVKMLGQIIFAHTIL